MIDIGIIGIDPGVTGAVTLLDYHNPNNFRIEDCPVFMQKTGKSKTPKPKSNPSGMFELLEDLVSEVEHPFVIMESVHARESDGKVSAYTFGQNEGLWEMALIALKLRHKFVPPTVWKIKIGLKGADKEGSRRKALELFPDAASFLKHKKHHNRAEALLMCEYAKRFLKEEYL